MAINSGMFIPLISAIGASLLISVTAAIYANGYEDATIKILEAKAAKLETTPERLSTIEAVLNDINRRLERMEHRIDLALGEHGKK